MLQRFHPKKKTENLGLSVFGEIGHRTCCAQLGFFVLSGVWIVVGAHWLIRWCGPSFEVHAKVSNAHQQRKANCPFQGNHPKAEPVRLFDSSGWDFFSWKPGWSYPTKWDDGTPSQSIQKESKIRFSLHQHLRLTYDTVNKMANEMTKWLTTRCISSQFDTYIICSLILRVTKKKTNPISSWAMKFQGLG